MFFIYYEPKILLFFLMGGGVGRVVGRVGGGGEGEGLE